MNDLINARCGWAGTDELYVKYHDEEWGKPVDDDRILFEFLVLESAQAGLSWITILRKREGYRKAFHRFDPERVAQMTPEEVDRLMRFDGIVRNRLKITAAINNAKLFRAIQKEFGSFYEYVLSFFPGRQPIVNDFKSLSQIPATSPESDAMSRDMKKERIQILRIDDLLRLLAGHGVRERPPDGLPLQRRPATDGPLSITLRTTVTTVGERSARQGRTIIASPKTSRIRFSPNTLSRYRSMSHCKRRNRKQSV